MSLTYEPASEPLHISDPPALHQAQFIPGDGYGGVQENTYHTLQVRVWGLGIVFEMGLGIRDGVWDGYGD